MTNSQTITYSLDLKNFSLEFLVDLKRSLDETRRFSSQADPDFVFIRGETWIRVNDSQHLVVDEMNNGNLLVTLKQIAAQLDHSPDLIDPVHVIQSGGWGRWIRGYWKRFMDDESMPEDEERYSRFIRLLVAEGQGGRIAAYRSEGASILEVSVSSGPGSTERIVDAWVKVEDVSRLVVELNDLGAKMRDAVLPLHLASWRQ